MTRRDGLYYTARKDGMMGYRPMVICYGEGRKLWTVNQSIHFPSRDHALERAAYEADYMAGGHNPRPIVRALTNTTTPREQDT